MSFLLLCGASWSIFYEAGLVVTRSFSFCWSGNVLTSFSLRGTLFPDAGFSADSFSFWLLAHAGRSFLAVLWWEAVGTQGPSRVNHISPAALKLSFCLWFFRIGWQGFLVWASDFLSLEFIEFPRHMYLWLLPHLENFSHYFFSCPLSDALFLFL